MGLIEAAVLACLGVLFVAAVGLAVRAATRCDVGGSCDWTKWELRSPNTMQRTCRKCGFVELRSLV